MDGALDQYLKVFSEAIFVKKTLISEKEENFELFNSISVYVSKLYISPGLNQLIANKKNRSITTPIGRRL